MSADYSIEDVPPHALKIMANYFRTRAKAADDGHLDLLATERGRLDIVAARVLNWEASCLESIAERKTKDAADPPEE